MKSSVLFVFVVFIFANFFFVSCNKDSDTTYDADVDVFLKKKMVDDVEKYVPICYVYGSAAIKSATVTTPDGDEITLSASEGYSTIFLYSVTDDDYTEERPEAGNYTFDIVFTSGDTYSTTDYLYSSELDIPTISECSWNSDDDEVDISWEEVDDVYAYNVNIFNADGEIMYASAVYNSSATELAIAEDSDTGTWYETPEADEELTVVLNAYSYESDASETYWAYNLQCNSVAETTVTWNPISD